MRCEEIMKDGVKCVSPQDPLEQAARLMRDENVGFLPVCDDAMRVLGTLTDRDIAIRAVADSRSSDTPVEQVMTRELVTCSPEDELERAAELMASQCKSRIMCTEDDGTLVGVISLSDLARCAGVEQTYETLRQVTEREVRA
jgi:CBS domain-containing protein